MVTIGYLRLSGQADRSSFDQRQLLMREMQRDALFLAGQAHAAYRSRGGLRTGVRADFMVGAHAAVAGCPLLTRDRRRYAAYFPTLALVTPESRAG